MDHRADIYDGVRCIGCSRASWSQRQHADALFVQHARAIPQPPSTRTELPIRKSSMTKCPKDPADRPQSPRAGAAARGGCLKADRTAELARARWDVHQPLASGIAVIHRELSGIHTSDGWRVREGRRAPAWLSTSLMKNNID